MTPRDSWSSTGARGQPLAAACDDRRRPGDSSARAVLRSAIDLPRPGRGPKQVRQGLAHSLRSCSITSNAPPPATHTQAVFLEQHIGIRLHQAAGVRAEAFFCSFMHELQSLKRHRSCLNRRSGPAATTRRWSPKPNTANRSSKDDPPFTPRRGRCPLGTSAATPESGRTVCRSVSETFHHLRFRVVCMAGSSGRARPGRRSRIPRQPSVTLAGSVADRSRVDRSPGCTRRPAPADSAPRRSGR